MVYRTEKGVVTRSALVVLAGALWSFGAGAGVNLAGSEMPGQLQPQGAAQQPAPAARQPEPASASQPVQSEDEKAIRAFEEEYARDYNKADTKALAARFTEDAEVVTADGERFEGRELIGQRLAETLAANPGARMQIEIESIRLLNPDAAKEEGRTIVTPAKGTPVSHRYVVLLVRRDGRWLMSSIREEPDPLVPAHDRLKELEWMVGDWVDEGADSHVRVSCRWSDDQNFLLRTFTIHVQGKPVLTVNQRIGWDPAARQIRSWEFDSEGGFGESKWGRAGERWIIKHTATRPDGTTASSTNIMVRERPDLVRWTSTDRFVGDESVPDDLAYVMVRVPPSPRSPSRGQATSPPSPSSKRSPQ